MNYTTILLDLDHTLFDTDESEEIAFNQAMRAAGVAEPDRHMAAYREINLALWAAVERGETTPHTVRTQRFEHLVRELGLDVDPLSMADAFVAGLAENGELYAGAFEVLEELSQHATLALVTNGFSDVQRARMERVNIGRFFKAVTISAETGFAKPGAGIFDVTFAALGFPEKEATLMVGDSLSSDIRGGSNYGIPTCWYNPSCKPATHADQITHEITELNELLALVDPGYG